MGGPPNSDMFTNAFQAKSNPKMDGDVLNDPAWESIPAITTFTQKSPDEGQIATENKPAFSKKNVRFSGKNRL